MLAILQFDSAALPLLERMLADGRMPVLAGLRRRGRWETMDARATFLQSSTYMTLCTGVDVREHGIYSAVPWSAPEQRPRFMYAFPGPPTIWDRLTARGRRALIVDPTLSWEPTQMCGVYLSGWQFEDRMSARGRSLPTGTRTELGRRRGRAPRLDDVYGTRRASSLLGWRTHLVDAPRRVADVAIEMLEQDRYDLVWLNFAAPHKAGHHLWDPGAVVHEALDDATRGMLEGGLADVYQATDVAIGRVLEALPGTADVIVFSPTGMAANTSRADVLPGMLDAILTPRPKNGDRARDRSRSPIWAIRSAIPIEVREHVARALPDRAVADLATRFYLRRDWTKTRAIAVPGENKGYIRVNLKGRERAGIVDAAEVDDLLDQITAGLLTFRDPDGSPSISRVDRMSLIAGAGRAVSSLPDLVVHWGDRPPAHLDHVSSPLHGDVKRHGVGSGRSGNHVDDAWAIVLPGSSRARAIGRAARITDIGTTACALLGGDTTGLTGTSLLETVS